MIELELRSSTNTGGRFALSLPSIVSATIDGEVGRYIAEGEVWQQMRNWCGTFKDIATARIYIGAGDT